MKFAQLSIVFVTILCSCQSSNEPGTFGFDLQFLGENKELTILKSTDGQQQLIIIPDYQGRVMTSTSSGLEGNSYGWINYDHIVSGQIVEHMNAFGGEDRFWLGPEGGQYSIFFEKDSEFNLDAWQTPPAIDSEPFKQVSGDESSATFKRNIKLVNYSGFQFDIDVTRSISLLSESEIEQSLGIVINLGLSYVAFQSENTIQNVGNQWSRESGLLSIWILGMFTPSPAATVAVPYRDSLELNTTYFGEIPADRLQVKGNTVLFKADGKYRGKIGLPSQNATPFAGSYDAAKNVLTIVEYTFNSDTTYVNSMWELQDEPYKGDVINSYNDGPQEDGSQLGPFYELETSSSTRELANGESITHIHKTYHFEGELQQVDAIAQKVLGLGLSEIGI
ncbi:MAG: hypothetical protein O2887_02815 [Bacteroidetes bacterium]|nr:hypothetical protein [Bacteroidota bacterium]MDA1119422.1 hypothetical protein [Bacteroidota bacterium]